MKTKGAFAILEKINGRNVAGRVLEEIKQTSKEKTEKLFTYGVAVIVIGILLSVFQQAIGINAVLYYAPRIFESAGAEGGGMMQTVIMGVVNILFTLVAIFTVDRFGRKPLLIVGSIGMAVGAFAVALCDQMGIKGIVPVLLRSSVYAAFFMMSWGPICWVLIAEILPQHHPRKSRGHRRSVPMGVQLLGVVHLPGFVRFQSYVRLQPVWHHLSACSPCSSGRACPKPKVRHWRT